MTRMLKATVASAVLLLQWGCASGDESNGPSEGSSGLPGAGTGGARTSPALVGVAGVPSGSAGRAAESGTAGRNMLGTGVAGAGGRAANGGAAGRNRMGNAGVNVPAAGSGGGVVPSGSAGAGQTTTGPIWMPKPGATWQWQLTGNIDTSLDVEMYDVDLFTTSNDVIQTLHAAGHKVVCYFSAGSYEPNRPDSAALAQTGPGKTLDGWPDEKWLDVRKPAVRELMKARLDVAKDKHCDGVEPDNVDGYDNDNGLGLTEQDLLDYDSFLATEAHARQLSIGLKNSLGLVSKLVSKFDWALNEECLKYDECDTLTPFISAGKAVFHCEYASSTNGVCGKAPKGFSTIVKRLDLDAFRLSCN